MNLPDDYALSPLATLAHVGDQTPSPHHSVFWQAFATEFWKSDPVLSVRHEPDPSDLGVTHEFTSTFGVRIGCRFLSPMDAAGRSIPVRAGVVALHGYTDVPSLAQDEDRWAILRTRGLAVLLVRVRGYPGSQIGVGDLHHDEFGYITVGLDAPMHKPEDALGWIFPRAIADAANAWRALTARLTHDPTSPSLPAPPVYLHGESFGGGLAVLGASVLSSRHDVPRLAIAIPAMGDWPWRLAHAIPRATLGMGRELRELLARVGAREESVADSLRLCDAALHARAVRGSVLCKLALRDDLVPAPTQAAIFNALGSAPGTKWRFTVPYGHYDGGLANARRHAEFDRLVKGFLDPASDLSILPH